MIVATCSHSREPATPASPSAPSPLDALLRSASAPSAESSAESFAPPLPTAAASEGAERQPAPPSAPGPSPRGPGHELDNFYASLRTLEKRARQSHVRIAWLGDSHGASDLWSGPLRAALQKQFGDGGPGYVHLGYKAYRHDNMRIEVRGKWVSTPRAPSTAVHSGDGVFGLGGMLYTGAEGPRATLIVSDPALPAELSWDLCYKLTSPSDEIQISLTGAPDHTLKPAPGEALHTLRHLVLKSNGGSPSLRAVPVQGQPAFCGVTIDTDPRTQPGVVLDTLGINGARLTTPLAWNEAAWTSELARRPPQLVILEYGTNESGDHVIKADRYVENLRLVMARVRAASPEADCLVLAPTDRADTPDRTPEVRDALKLAARESKCAFWDTYEKMGGRGSIGRWHHESPSRAGGDGVHLTTRGYKDLGEMLTRDVLAGYRP